MSYCSHCGSPNKASSKFCNNCGAVLSAPSDVRCAICGSANKLENVYCSTCGGRLEANPSVQKGAVDTIVPLPSPPREVPAVPWQVAGTKEQIDGVVPPTEPEIPGRRMPEWIGRLQPASSVKEGTPSAPEVKEELQVRNRRPEQNSANEAEPGGCEGPSERRGDWLANLRAAAMMELEAASVEPSSSELDSEPPPIPRWFVYVRPPLPEPEEQDSAPEKPLEAPTYVAEQQEPHVLAGEPAARPTEPGAMPDRLVQLESFPLPLDQATLVITEKEAASRPEAGEQTESSHLEGIPEWIRQLAREAPEIGLSGTVKAAVPPPAANQVDQTAISGRNPQAGSELPLSREEERGLPDWLVAPIESGPLLGRLKETQAEQARDETAPVTPAEHRIATEEVGLNPEETNSPVEPAVSVTEKTDPPTMQDGTRAEELQTRAESKEVGAKQIETPQQPGGPPEISELHSRMAKSITEIQTRLHVLWRRMAAAHEQATPPASLAHETLEMHPGIIPPVPVSEEKLAEQDLAIEMPTAGVGTEASPWVGQTAEQPALGRPASDDASSVARTGEQKPIFEEPTSEHALLSSRVSVAPPIQGPVARELVDATGIVEAPLLKESGLVVAIPIHEGLEEQGVSEAPSRLPLAERPHSQQVVTEPPIGEANNSRAHFEERTAD